MTGGAGHLGDRVSRYVDRTLGPDVLRRLDRHLVICELCRAAVDAERRLLASLRASRTPAVPTTLTAALHGLSSSPAPRPSFSAAPSPVLSTVSSRAPALHRSPVRAVLLAGLAAGASAAAAWGIAATGSVTGTSGSDLQPDTLPAARLGGQLDGGSYAVPASARLSSDGPFAHSWGLPARTASSGPDGSATGVGGAATGVGGAATDVGGASWRVLPVAVPLAAHPRRRRDGAGRQWPHD